MASTFTGRQAERRLIADLVAGVSGGEPRALAFVGEAGVGKSRLLREAAVGSHVRRLHLVGYEPEAGVPFAAARDLLRATETADGERGTARVASVALADPMRLSESVFAALSAAGPAILVVDDLQWLDPQSAALLHYVARGAVASRRPIGLLVATRPSPQSAPILASLERLLEETGAPVVRELSPLDEVSSVALVRAAVPGISEAEAAEIWRSVGGSPYWLLALARSRGSDPADVLGERLRRVSPDAAALLALLAVAGRPMSARSAGELLDWPESRVAAAVRELASTGLMVERVDGLRPAHDLVREAVLRELPAEGRREWHARLAIALEAPTGEDVQRLQAALRHRIEARLPALALAVRIAESEGRRWLDHHAIAELGRIADEADPVDPLAPRLDLAVAGLASEVGAADIAFERWRRIAASTSGPDRATATLAAAREAFRLRRPEELEQLLAGLDAPEWDPVEAVEAGALRASSRLWVESRFPEGRELATRVVAEARHLDATAPAASGAAVRSARWAALRIAFDASLQAGDWAPLRSLAGEMVGLSRELDDRARIEALIYERLILRVVGKHAAAAHRAQEALTIARRAVLPDQTIEAGHFLALSLVELGRVSEAEATAVEAAELAARAADFPKLRARPGTLVHAIRLLTGPWQVALADLEADAAAQPDPHYRLAHRHTAAFALSHIDRERGAARVLRLIGASLSDAERARCPRCLRDTRHVAANVNARLGRRAEALRLLEEAVGDGPPFPPEPAAATMRTWSEALVTPDAEERADRLRAALPEIGRVRGAVERCWAEIDLALALRDTAGAAAAAQLRATGAAAELMGAATVALVADRLLRGLGQRTWRRAATLERVGAPTAREREVADRIVAGASNAEIAADLFVSVKTVERHVSNLLAKFDARNRTELAQRWAATGSEGIPR